MWTAVDPNLNEPSADINGDAFQFLRLAMTMRLWPQHRFPPNPFDQAWRMKDNPERARTTKQRGCNQQEGLFHQQNLGDALFRPSNYAISTSDQNGTRMRQ